MTRLWLKGTLLKAGLGGTFCNHLVSGILWQNDIRHPGMDKHFFGHVSFQVAYVYVSIRGFFEAYVMYVSFC